MEDHVLATMPPDFLMAETHRVLEKTGWERFYHLDYQLTDPQNYTREMHRDFERGFTELGWRWNQQDRKWEHPSGCCMRYVYNGSALRFGYGPNQRGLA